MQLSAIHMVYKEHPKPHLNNEKRWTVYWTRFEDNHTFSFSYTDRPSADNKVEELKVDNPDIVVQYTGCQK